MRAGRKIFFRINDILLVFNVGAGIASGATLEITLLDSSTPAGQVELALKPRLLDQVGSVQKLGVSIGRAYPQLLNTPAAH